ncbi:hypothetical protein GCM10023210_04150 [Chryseobacterium ginsengisoli]|uniref:Uncharacterized protein n=1 Tax=Chryseobacterium ginsengisoli TaxID=363853 RepID=A0ABP9LS19_9FLAO
MKAAKPVEIDNKSRHGNNKQKPKEQVVVPLPEVKDVGTQTQMSESSVSNIGSANNNNNKLDLNGTIAAVHGSQTIYDQGAQIMYGKLQESLVETGDINHPDTKKVEKGYMATLNVNQIQDYHNLKSGTYLPKTLQEQAAMAQSYQGDSETAVPGKPESADSVEAQAVQDSVAASDMSAEFTLPGEQEAEVRTTPTSPNSDPQFNQTVGLVKNTAKAKRVHNTKEKAETHANTAAAVPVGERKSKAKGQKVEQLDQQKTGAFSATSFKAKLKEKIYKVNLPVSEKDADNFEKRNNINAVNGLIKGDVMASKNSVTGSIESVAKQEPNEAKIAQRKATALPDPKIGSKVNIKATDAMPPKRGDSELSEPIAKSYQAVEQQFTKNHITDEQLANSNEPDFINALNAKKAAKENAENAPKEFKNAENKKLEASKQAAQGKTNSTMEGMHQSRKGLLDSVTNKQHKAGEKNTAKHQDVVEKLNTIYAETKKSVDGQLNDLETKVGQLFDDGAKKAKDAFEKEVTQKLEAYKAKRYGDWNDYENYGKRLTDAWNRKLPDEVNVFYKQGRDNFITAMDGVITKIAELVTTRLNAAKASITSGRQKVVSFIKNLPADVRKAIKGDIDSIQGQFKELESSISDKESSLIDTLTTKYNSALKEVDELIVDIKKRNRGFLASVEDATIGVAKTIMEIRKTLTELLSGAVSAVMAIVADPIGFLSNLIAGVSQGFTNFGTNIWTHLKTGFFGWLTGAMKNISFTLPEDIFSLKGIFSISSQILGLTWTDIRGIGADILGEPAMKGLEGSFKMVQIVQKEGFAGLWEHVKDQFADIKATVMDTIIDIIKTQAIQAGIKIIMSLLTPAGAFIKAAMMIIDLVKFFVQKAAQIMELVRAFTEGIKAIASGNVSAVAKAVENALGRSIPVLIGFLASLANLGGLADKVIGVIQKIRLRIKNAIVKFWNFIKGKAKGLLGKIGFGDKKEKKEKKGEDLRTTEEKKRDLEEGVKEGTLLLKDESLTLEEREKRLENIKQTYELKELKVVTEKVDSAGTWAYIFGKVNPDLKGHVVVLRMVDGEEIPLRPNQAAIIREKLKYNDGKIQHFRAILPTGIMLDLEGIGKKISINRNSKLKVVNVQTPKLNPDGARKRGLDTETYLEKQYIIINVNENLVAKINSSKIDTYEAKWRKKEYALGHVDCFSFAMFILRDELHGDMKREPEGEDNEARFSDLLLEQEEKELENRYRNTKKRR